MKSLSVLFFFFALTTQVVGRDHQHTLRCYAEGCVKSSEEQEEPQLGWASVLIPGVDQYGNVSYTPVLMQAQEGRVPIPAPQPQKNWEEGDYDDVYGPDDGGNERLKSASTRGATTGPSIEKPYLDAEIAQILEPDNGFDSIQIYLGNEVLLEEYIITRRFERGVLVKEPLQMIFRTDLLGTVDSVSGEIDEMAPSRLVVGFDKVNKDMILPFELNDEDRYVVFVNPEDDIVTDGFIYPTIYIHNKRWIVKSGYGANALYKAKNQPDAQIAKGKKIRR